MISNLYTHRKQGGGREVNRKTVLLGYALVLLLSCVGSCFQFAKPVRAATTWTVDDDGPADFSSIQEAINAASDGDIIYVKEGIYYENVVVGSGILLVGEKAETTIIDGINIGSVASFSGNNVTVVSFTLRNSGNEWLDSGIILSQAEICNISGNIVEDNKFGIHLRESANN